MTREPTLAFFLATVSACFQPPAPDVSFACEPSDPDRDVCPPGYACELDGCCHRDGSDVEAHFGDCALGQETNPTSESGNETTSTSETGDDDTESGTTGGDGTTSETG